MIAGDPHLAALNRIIEELEKLNTAQAPKRRPLTPNEVLRLARLLPALAGRFGSNCFTTAEILSDPVLREVAGFPTPKALGELLSKAVGVDIAGLTVERVVIKQHQTVWKIKETKL